MAPPPIAPPPGSHGAGPAGTPPDQDRPPPTLASLAGALAGILLLGSLFLFLGEFGGDNRRVGGIVLSLLFEGLGVVLILLNRNQRAATAGVVLTAIGLVPLLVYVFVDVRNPGRTINSVGKFTSTATTVLIVAALFWLAAYFFGPGRRYGFYLGAALVALWLVAIVQIIDAPIGAVVDSFGAPSVSSFTPIGPGIGTGSSSSGSSSGGGSRSTTTCRYDPNTGRTRCTSSGSSSGSSTDFGQSTPDPFTPSSRFDSQRPEDPSTKLGIASLIFGGAYLAYAARRDRRRDARQATVLFAVSVPILTLGVLFMGNVLHVTGTALLAIAVGGLTAWLATRVGRRFSSWFATLGVVIAVFVLVDQAVGESGKVSGVVLAAIALAVVFGVRALEGRTDGTPSDGANPFDTGPWGPGADTGAFAGAGLGATGVPPQADGPPAATEPPSWAVPAVPGPPSFSAPPAVPWAPPNRPSADPSPWSAPSNAIAPDGPSPAPPDPPANEGLPSPQPE